MTNWYAHAKIWEHFDSFLDDGVRRSLQGDVCNEGTGGCAATCSDGSPADAEEREKKETIASGGLGDTGPVGGSSKENSRATTRPAGAAAAEDRSNSSNKNGAELDPYHDAAFNHRSSLGRVIQL